MKLVIDYDYWKFWGYISSDDKYNINVAIRNEYRHLMSHPNVTLALLCVHILSVSAICSLNVPYPRDPDEHVSTVCANLDEIFNEQFFKYFEVHDRSEMQELRLFMILHPDYMPSPCLIPAFLSENLI